MTGNAGIMWGFRGLQKAADPAELPQLIKLILPSGKYLMGITLVTDIKNQPVTGRIKTAVQCNRQLYHTQIGCQMSSGF